MDNKKICPKCKKEFPFDEVYCNMCGVELIDNNSASQETEGNVQQNNNQFNGYVPPNISNQNNPAYNQNPNNQSKKVLYVILIIIGVMLILVLGILIGKLTGGSRDYEITEESTYNYDTTSSYEEETTEETTKEKLKGISSNDNYLYGVGDGYDGGAVYLMMYYTCEDTDFDGYEVRLTNPYDTSITIPSFYVDKKWECVYYGSQDPGYTVEIRTYRGDAKSGDAEYSDWYKLCDLEGATSLFSSQVNMLDSEWNEKYKDKGFELDYYNYY